MIAHVYFVYAAISYLKGKRMLALVSREEKRNLTLEWGILKIKYVWIRGQQLSSEAPPAGVGGGVGGGNLLRA